VLHQIADERHRLEHELGRHTVAGERIADIRIEMQDTMEQHAGIYRDGGALAKAADKLQELRERFGRTGIDDHSRTFNTELPAALELSFMLDVARAW
jgi:fumarate reductase flavoprotein subunit